MTNQEQQHAFLAAIKSAPSDLTTRLIYADWLEDQGRESEADLQRWEARLAANPYDPALRSEFAKWLTKQGEDQQARQQAWMAKAVRGNIPRKFPIAVIGRQGVLIEDTYVERDSLGIRSRQRVRKSIIQNRNYWLKKVAELFNKHPEVLFIVVSDAAPTKQGFRYERPIGRHYRSPILFYRRSDNWGKARSSKVSRVLV
jgi:uncharacterized protein (TIGR02996 family)